MKNFFRIALAAGIAALGAVAFTPKADAQTANVDFSGTLSPTCSINNVVAGTFGVDPFHTSPVFVSSEYGTGIPGKVNVSCNGGVAISVSDVVDNGSTPTLFNKTSQARVWVTDNNAELAYYEKSPLGGTVGPVRSTIQAGPINNKEYRVNLRLGHVDQPLTPGTYQARVSVLFAAQ